LERKDASLLVRRASEPEAHRRTVPTTVPSASVTGELTSASDAAGAPAETPVTSVWLADPEAALGRAQVSSYRTVPSTSRTWTTMSDEMDEAMAAAEATSLSRTPPSS
jgi:hypothetical protein